MGVFDDKKFDELDWISQATEPIDSAVNEVLGKLPDSLDVTFDVFYSAMNSSYSTHLSIDRLIAHLIESSDMRLDGSQERLLRNCFTLEVNGNEVIVNFENRTITGGTIRLIKTATTMDEKILSSILGKEGIQALSWLKIPDITRANDIMEIMGKCEEGLKSRSDRRKRQAIIQRLKDLMTTNEWNIRDTELANKLGKWIAEYISHGNLAAYSNFCRLKVMTHKNQPIYSMEEVQ